ncbi:CHC2 zinc finger domain-containing protein [Mucilaginibacter sp. UYCu711]|uniref:CHC2 zinc finger domain-containing protein n=1 Tax=Mucilaginibacter sp. UYCu711 TaxID=3156339 RepID=UPI003D2521D7
MLRKEVARLTNIQDTVRKYVSMNRQLQCNCPFHKGPYPTLIWNARKGSYKCEVCGESGDLIDFVMKMEGWDYNTTFHKLAGRLRHQESGIVYVLELTDGCYYIGYTLDLVNRMNLHFNGKGAYWTKVHQPVRVADVRYQVKYSMEDRITEQYIRRFGKDKVRGGRYVGADLDA